MPKPPVAAPPKKRCVWSGPEGRCHNGGVSQSMIARWLSDRWRFALANIEGLRPVGKFSAPRDYGTMFHLCDEVHSAGGDWAGRLKEHAAGLCRTYPADTEEIEKYWRACRVIFPEYVVFWAKTKEQVETVPLLQEFLFDIDYRLPLSGRVVRLRGKMDGVNLTGPGGRSWVVRLGETKTKYEIDREEVERILDFDIQTQLYLLALHEIKKDPKKLAQLPDKAYGALRQYPIEGVIYNVAKRPWGSGAGCIRQLKGKTLKDGTHKPGETTEAFFERLRQFPAENPQEWFARWTSDVSPADIAAFRKNCLDPILENMADWFAQVTGRETKVPDGYRTPLHFRHPNGCKNFLDSGGVTEYDGFLKSGNEAGLFRTDSLFEELV